MAAAAGWYTDPHDPSGRRYWDGTAWTEHTAPAAAPTAATPPSAPAWGTPTPSAPWASGFPAQGTPTRGPVQQEPSRPPADVAGAVRAVLLAVLAAGATGGVWYLVQHQLASDGKQMGGALGGLALGLMGSVVGVAGSDLRRRPGWLGAAVSAIAAGVGAYGAAHLARQGTPIEHADVAGVEFIAPIVAFFGGLGRDQLRANRRNLLVGLGVVVAVPLVAVVALIVVGAVVGTDDDAADEPTKDVEDLREACRLREAWWRLRTPGPEPKVTDPAAVDAAWQAFYSEVVTNVEDAGARADAEALAAHLVALVGTPTDDGYAYEEHELNSAILQFDHAHCR